MLFSIYWLFFYYTIKIFTEPFFLIQFKKISCSDVKGLLLNRSSVIILFRFQSGENRIKKSDGFTISSPG